MKLTLSNASRAKEGGLVRWNPEAGRIESFSEEAFVSEAADGNGLGRSSWVVPAAALRGGMAAVGECEFSVKGSSLVLEGAGCYRIRLSDPDSFREMREADADIPLGDAPFQVLHAASTDQTRLALCGVYCNEDGACASDGRRASMVGMDKVEGGHIIPAIAMNILARADGDLFYGAGQHGLITVRRGNTCVTLRGVEAEYPNVASLWDMAGKVGIMMPADELRHAARGCAYACTGEAPSMIMDVVDGRTRVHIKTEASEYSQDIAIGANEYHVGINPQFLLDALGDCEGDVIVYPENDAAPLALEVGDRRELIAQKKI